MHNIGDLIRIERQKKGYSQDYIAQQLNITQQAYSKIEKRPQKTCLETILKIATFLELNLSDFQDKLKNEKV